MRRSDREIKDRQEIIDVIGKCDVCRIALNDDGYPYIVPLNFGMREEDGTVVFYFHGAKEGKKYDLIRRDNRASFEMDCGHQLFLEEERGNCTMTYECVMGRGRIEIVPDEEKEEALILLMEHYRSADFPFNRAVIPMTTVFKLVVEEMTGKRRAKKMPTLKEK